MLGQRRRRWANNKTTMAQGLVFGGISYRSRLKSSLNQRRKNIGDRIHLEVKGLAVTLE